MLAGEGGDDLVATVAVEIDQAQLQRLAAERLQPVELGRRFGLEAPVAGAQEYQDARLAVHRHQVEGTVAVEVAGGDGEDAVPVLFGE